MRRSDSKDSSSSPSLSMGQVAMLGLGAMALGAVALAARKPVSRSSVGKMTGWGTQGTRKVFQLKNKFLGMPVKAVREGSAGVPKLKQVLKVLDDAHSMHHKFGFKSGEKVLDDAFESFKPNPDLLCRLLEEALEETQAPFTSYYEENHEAHVYGVFMSLELSEDSFAKAQALTAEDVLTTSASHFPGGFEVRERGSGKMPRSIVLAGGDNVDIKGDIPLRGGMRVGGFYQFMTRYHSLHGMLIHSAWLNMVNRRLYVARFGIGEAPKLQGKGMGALDMVNVQEGPHVWAGADLQMVRQIFGEEVFEALLAQANSASGRKSPFGFESSYWATGQLANKGGKVARPVKTYVLPFLRDLQDLLRGVDE